MIESLRNWFRSPVPPPKTVNLYITDRCNLLCEMCNVGINNRRKKELSIGRSANDKSGDTITLDMICRMLSGIATWKNHSSVYISGGEPLMEKEKVFAAISKCKELGIAVGMNSNAMNLTEDVADRLVASGLNGITLSVDGTRAIHDSIRGVEGSFDRVANAVQYLQRAREKHGRHVSVMTLSAISPKNYMNLGDMVEELVAWKLDAITFSHYAFTSTRQKEEHNKTFANTPFYTHSTVGGEFTENDDIFRFIDCDALHKQVLRVREFVAEAGYASFSFSPNLSSQKDLVDYYQHDLKPMNQYFHKHCQWFNQRIDVDCDGNVMLGYPCFRFKLGTLMDGSVVDLWNSKKARDIRQFVQKKANMPACLRCCGNRIKT